MLLEITVVEDGAGREANIVELSVRWPAEILATECSGKSLSQALAPEWPACGFTVAGVPLDGLQAGIAPLIDGAIVMVRPNAPYGSNAPLLQTIPTAVPTTVPTTGPQGLSTGGTVNHRIHSVPVNDHRSRAGVDNPRTGRLDGGNSANGRSVNSDSATGDSGNGDGAMLVVTAGPSSGAIFSLQRGSYSIGRGRCRITVADPALSRHHGTLVVGAQTLTLFAAPGSAGFEALQLSPSLSAQAGSAPISANSPKHFPSQLHIKGNGPPLQLTEGMAICCGSSVLELRLPEAAEEFWCEGESSIMSQSQQSDTLLDSAALEPIGVTKPSGSGNSRWIMILTALLPLILGVGLALATGSMMFLAFSAMSAAAVLPPLLGGSRRRDFRERLLQAMSDDIRRQKNAFPDAATLMISSHEPRDLASRAPPDVMTSGTTLRTGVAVRVGTGIRPPRVAVRPEGSSFAPTPLPARPVCATLSHQPLTIGGTCGAVLALLNFLVMQLDAARIPVVILSPTCQVPLAVRFLPATMITCSEQAAAKAISALYDAAERNVPQVVLLAVDTPLQSLLDQFVTLGAVHFSTSGTGIAASSRRVRPDSNRASATEACSHGSAPSSMGAMPAKVRLTAAGNRVQGTMDGRTFVPDGVPDSVLDRYARQRAWQEARNDQPNSPGTVQQRSSLAPNTLPAPETTVPGQLLRDWLAALGGPLRPVPLGRDAKGTTTLDLLRDGPHILVAGTTGSGKSEFLRSLVGGLAMAHSPADLQFVFIDFKGGAGLSVLGKFPHTSSLITDLAGQGMDRTLASLRAELHRRETVLARAEAPDAASYRAALQQNPVPDTSGSPASMAHLVVVIDEFRVLVDQFPDAMNELMRIAAVGRSLGIHLIMSTQRPQGAVNSDIRANVTSSICLRMQSAFESTDVIGTGVAADISVTTPGRAFISRAGGRPEEFQSATLQLPSPGSTPLPLVQPAWIRLSAMTPSPASFLTPTPIPIPADPSVPRTSDVTLIAALLSETWRQLLATAGGPLGAAPPVIAQDLPDGRRLSHELCGAAVSSGAGVVLGVIDVPEHQTVAVLRWNPQDHSHVACFGTAAETSAFIGLVVQQLLREKVGSDSSTNVSGYGANRTAPGRRPLLYLLDGDGSLASFAHHPRVGSYITPNQLRTATHLITRLAEVVPTNPVIFALCISDWGRWATALRASPWHATEEDLTELVRFSRANLVVVIGGDRELFASRFLPSIPNRVFLTQGTSSESTLLWPRLPRFVPLPGRAAITGPINATASHGAAEHPHIAQFAVAGVSLESSETDAEAQRWGDEAAAGSMAADSLRVTDLPSALSVSTLRSLVFQQPSVLAVTDASPVPRHVQAQSRSQGQVQGQVQGQPQVARRQIVLGLGGDGDDLTRLTVTPGMVLPIIGLPGSGKSSFVRGLSSINGGLLWPTDGDLALPQDDAGDAGSNSGFDSNPDPYLGPGVALSTVDPTGSAGLLREDPSDVSSPLLWLDDAAMLPAGQLLEAERRRALGAILIVAMDYPGPALAHLPLEWGLRSAQHGIVLSPQRSSDAELFGVRLETAGGEPPGRAVLISRGRCSWFQFPAAPESPS